MYEARQNKEKQNRTIENRINTNIRNKGKVYTPNTYVNQMMLWSKKEPDKQTLEPLSLIDFNINEQDGFGQFIERLNYLHDISNKPITNNILSFYGVYFGCMGPHTIAHSSLKETINNLLEEDILATFCQLIQTPEQIQMILANEAIFYPKSEFNDNLGLNSPHLNSYIETYSKLYNICSDIADFFQENIVPIGIIRQNLYSDTDMDNTSKIEQLWGFLQENMIKLLNLNPYATYAWHQQDGYTKQQISGKGEVKCNLLNIRNEEDFKSNLSKFFDGLSLQSTTFHDMSGFIEYICLFFPEIPKQRIKELLYQSYDSTPQSVAITITDEEINNYFNDMCYGDYIFYLKKIATISIIMHVDINLFAQKLLEHPRIMDVLETILVVASDANEESVNKVSQLVSILKKSADGNKAFMDELSVLLDTNFNNYRKDE